MVNAIKGIAIMEYAEANLLDSPALLTKNVILAWRVDTKWSGPTILTVYLSKRLEKSVSMIMTARWTANAGTQQLSMFLTKQHNA